MDGSAPHGKTLFSAATRVTLASRGRVSRCTCTTAPFSRGDSHATDACLAALAQQHAVEKLRKHLSDVLGLRRDLPELSVRMGLATGDLIVGTIGAPNARSFTVIGDTVNLASRLEGANNAYETSILVDEGTFQLAQNDVEGREIDFLTVSGKIEPVRVYEIMAPAGCLSGAENEMRGLFAEALPAYRARDWDRSEQRFAQCLAVVPNDGPAAVFRRRIEFLRGQSLPAYWDAVWHLTDKQTSNLMAAAARSERKCRGHYREDMKTAHSNCRPCQCGEDLSGCRCRFQPTTGSELRRR
jgi:hypothetical protein